MYIVAKGELIVTKQIQVPVIGEQRRTIDEWITGNKFQAEKSEKMRTVTVNLRIEGYSQLIGDIELIG